MTTYLAVEPGVNLSRALGGERLTKKWVRERMREHPEWDWRILTPGFGSYINGQDAIANDVTLQVMRDGSTVAMVNFQSSADGDWGYQAVVH
jgi:hypothetical protein